MIPDHKIYHCCTQSDEGSPQHKSRLFQLEVPWADDEELLRHRGYFQTTQPDSFLVQAP